MTGVYVCLAIWVAFTIPAARMLRREHQEIKAKEGRS